MSRNVPKLRFPEFTGEWEEKKLGDIGEFFNGLSGKSKVDFVDGNMKYVTYMNVFKNIIAKETEVGFVKVGDNEKQNMVEYGDIMFTQSSETLEDVGTSSVWLGAEKVLLNSFCFGYRLFGEGKKIDPLFFNYALRSDVGRQHIIKEGQGSTRINISASRLSGVGCATPIEIEEQLKIANFLSTLDSRITVQTEKVEILEKIKKGYMQRIFSQELRFKREDGSEYPDWEEKRLGELGDIVTGTTPSTKVKEYYSEQGVMFVTPTDINNKYTMNTARRLSEAGIEKGRKIPKGAVLVTCIASIGKNTIVREDVSCNQQINAIVPYESNNNEFIYYAIEKNVHLLKGMAGTGTMQMLNKTDFSSIEMYIPVKEEQTKIADFLSNLDNKIEVERKMLETLQGMKKGFLQKMFV